MAAAAKCRPGVRHGWQKPLLAADPIKSRQGICPSCVSGYRLSVTTSIHNRRVVPRWAEVVRGELNRQDVPATSRKRVTREPDR